MDYFRNIVMLAAIAGAIAGLGMTVAQSFATVPLILKAETFEAQGMAEAPAAAHEHATEIPAHSHGDEEGWAPEDGFERTAFTAAANIVTGIGFALLLIAVSELFGGIRDWRQGVYWGLAAFAVFTLAPGLGLPPELPIWVDAHVMTRPEIVLGGGSRSMKVRVAPDALLGLPSAPGERAPTAREELSDAENRLLAALTRPATHVVTASEDDPVATGARREDVVLPDSARRGPVTPVFQEPTG